MLFTKEHVHVKNSILEKQNVPPKSIEMNIAVLRKSSEVGDHLLVNPDHNITWQIIAKAPQASAHEKQGRATTARLVTKFRSHRCVAWKVARQPPGRRVVTCADYSF